MWLTVIVWGVCGGLGLAFLSNGLGLPSKYGKSDVSGETILIGIVLLLCCYGWFYLMKDKEDINKVDEIKEGTLAEGTKELKCIYCGEIKYNCVHKDVTQKRCDFCFEKYPFMENHRIFNKYEKGEITKQELTKYCKEEGLIE